MSKAVIKTFVKLYQQKLVYKDTKLVNWDTKLETAISDLEVEQKEVQSNLYYIKYKVVGENNQNLSSGYQILDIKPVPKEIALHNNYPNPFNPVTTINYDLPKEAKVLLIVYDLMGREVARLNDSFMPAGYHSVQWNSRNQYGAQVSAGVYFYHIQAGEFIKTQKMILLK